MLNETPLELRILRYIDLKGTDDIEIPVHPKDLEKAIKAFPDLKFRPLKTRCDNYKIQDDLDTEHNNE